MILSRDRGTVLQHRRWNSADVLGRLVGRRLVGGRVRGQGSFGRLVDLRPYRHMRADGSGADTEVARDFSL